MQKVGGPAVAPPRRGNDRAQLRGLEREAFGGGEGEELHGAVGEGRVGRAALEEGVDLAVVPAERERGGGESWERERGGRERGGGKRE